MRKKKPKATISREPDTPMERYPERLELKAVERERILNPKSRRSCHRQYKSDQQKRLFVQQLMETGAALPGVTAAGFKNPLLGGARLDS